MAHLVTNRPRMADLSSRETRKKTHLSWEQVMSLIYILGSMTFLLGNVFLFPVLDYSDLGVALLLFGSCLFWLVSGHDLLEVFNFWAIHSAREGADTLEKILSGIMFSAAGLFVISCIFQFSGSYYQTTEDKRRDNRMNSPVDE